MNKYINTKEIRDLIDNGFVINRLRDLVDNAQEMVSAEDVNTILRMNSSNDIKLKDIYNLASPHQEKFGGFTIPEWEQLRKLPYIMVSGYLDSGIHTYELNNFIKRKGIDSTISLNSDPEGFYRAQVGDVSPVPDNTKVELILVSGSTPTGLAYSFSWECENISADIKGYRVLGAADASNI